MRTSYACASGGCSGVSDPGPGVTGTLGALVREFRARGGRAGVGEVLAAHRALTHVDCASREDTRLALRAVLCSSKPELEWFEAAFVAVFGSPEVRENPLRELGQIEREVLPRVAVPGVGEPALAAEEVAVPVAWSSVELLREKDFARYNEHERLLARELIAKLARRGPTRRSRRTRPDRRRSHAPDLRRTVRASMRTAGEPIHRFWQGPTVRPRQLVLVCDVSGSMAPYARMLLQYLHACVVARRRVEAFAFGTRLTRITAELAGRDPDQSLERATAAVLDMAGGTRIGASLAELNRTFGRRIGRGSVVVILSDGWDRGDPEALAAEMARLRRTAHRLVWLNPLAAGPAYEPLTRGMRAAVPHTDRLLPGNSLASLEELAAILEEM